MEQGAWGMEHRAEVRGQMILALRLTPYTLHLLSYG